MTVPIVNCGWCDEPATVKVELEPAVYKYIKAREKGAVREKVMTKRAINVMVCSEHLEMVQRNRKEKADRVAAAKQEREDRKAAKKAGYNDVEAWRAARAAM